MEQSATVEIRRPTREVWELAKHPGAWQAWSPDLEDVHVEGGGEVRAGARLRYRWRGREVRAEVTEYEPGRRVMIAADQGGYEFREGFSLRERGDRTEATFTMGMTPRAWWMRAAAVGLYPLRSFLLGRPVRAQLRALREAAEGRR